MRAILNKILNFLRPKKNGPVIISRKKHNISRKNISANALKVLYRLNDCGFEAYLVGGCVRDLLLGKQPKDFDVATNARPEQVRRIFRNCRLIGRRFRLAHVVFRDEIIEVATFRAAHNGEESQHASQSEDGMILRDNVFGTLEDDAWRRDFTVNALYYTVKGFQIVDHTGGMADIRAKRLAMIGDPDVRFKEDPVRILRAIRFHAKLNLTLNKDIVHAIAEHKKRLFEVPSARLFEEVVKLFHSGKAKICFDALKAHKISHMLFKSSQVAYEKDADFARFFDEVLVRTDDRIQQGLSVNPAFMLSAMLWGPLQYKVHSLMHTANMRANHALSEAIPVVLAKQVDHFLIPKRLQMMMVDIWRNQSRLARRHPKRAINMLEEKSFRASYDFLLIRAETDPKLAELANWWTKFIDADEAKRKEMLKTLNRRARPKKTA